MKIPTRPLILASKSPRRKELLQSFIYNFSIIPSSFDETSLQIKEPQNYVKMLSLCKANTVANLHQKSWVIGADTIVTIDNKIFGKPLNNNNATFMLKNLTGRVHQVYTGYTIVCSVKNVVLTKTVLTNVELKKMTIDEIQHYVSTGESLDKSGGYGIQGIGACIIKGIKGSYTNVMGLPVCEIMEDLINMNIIKLTSET